MNTTTATFHPAAPLVSMNHPALVSRSWKGTPISRRTSDGYVNATAMCKANNKQWSKYRESDRCQTYLDALAETSVIRMFDLIESRQGQGGGTWVHPHRLRCGWMAGFWRASSRRKGHRQKRAHRGCGRSM